MLPRLALISSLFVLARRESFEFVGQLFPAVDIFLERFRDQ